MAKDFWTQEEDAKLRELCEKGHTASQMSRMLPGRSRNSVIGRTHRLKIVRVHVYKPRRKKVARTSGWNLKSQKRTKMPKLRPVAVHPLNIELLSLKKSDCRYPYGSLETGTLFCGHQIQDESSYCPFHADIAYTVRKRK